MVVACGMDLRHFARRVERTGRAEGGPVGETTALGAEGVQMRKWSNVPWGERWTFAGSLGAHRTD